MSLRSFRRAFFPTLAVMATVCSTFHAQTSTGPETQGNSTQTNTGVYTGREVVVPKTEEKKEPEPTLRSFADGFLRNTRRHVGFSVGASNFYAPDVAKSSDGRKANSFMSFQPQLYSNLQKRNLYARLTYGVVYRGYNKGLEDLNTFTQNGTASLVYSLSGRKMSLNFSDSVGSVYYDSESFSLERYLPSQYSVDFTPQIYVDKRQETRNTASVDMNYNLTRRGSLNANVSHDVLHYDSSVPTRTVLMAGVGGSYHLTRWLNFDTRYTTYLNLAEGQASNDVQNLQFGGLEFDFGKGWVASMSGGIESTNTAATRWMTGGGHATISKTSGGTTIQLGYHEGYSILSVGSQVWRGHTASAYLVQKLFRQIRLHGNASYFKGSSLLGNSGADTIYGGTGADVAFQKNFVVSTSFSFVSQRLVNVSAAGPNLYRYNASIGVNYYLPSIR